MTHGSKYLLNGVFIFGYGTMPAWCFLLFLIHIMMELVEFQWHFNIF